MSNFFVDIRQDLIYSWPSRSFWPIFKVKRVPKLAYPLFRWFLCDMENHFLGDPDSGVKNAKFLCTFVKTLSIQLVFPHGSTTHLKIKRALKWAYLPFRRFWCDIANHFLGDPDPNVKNAKIFCGCLLRPWVYMLWDLTNSPTHFQSQTSPKARIPPFRRFLWAIAYHFLGYPDSSIKNAKIFVDVRQDLVYTFGCPSWSVRPILKVKRS